jgi:membrane protein
MINRWEGRVSFLGWVMLALGILIWPRGPTPQTAERREPGRGRSAEAPHQIPARGWKDIAVRTWSEFNADQIPQVAGGVTFFAILSIFPAMAAFVSLYGLFADVGAADRQLTLLANILPREAIGFVGDEMTRIAGAKHAPLGLAFALSLLLSIWSSNGAVKALFSGLNVAYEEHERRGIVKLNLVSLAFTVGGLVFMMATLGALIAAPIALQIVGWRGSLNPVLISLLRWPALLIVTAGAFALLYRFGPSRQQARWRWISWGSGAAALVWLLASMLFSWYVANFGHYERTYGSLGAVVGFMTWMWISTMVILFGAELNAEIEHQTAVDSTTGAEAALGERGARMADTLGPAAGSRGKKAAPDPASSQPPASPLTAGAPQT